MVTKQDIDDRVAKLETTVKGTTPKNIKVKL